MVGVTLNVTEGYSKTITGRITLSALGTLLILVAIQKSVCGANPKLKVYTGTELTPSVIADGFFGIDGSDNITIDAPDLV